MVQLFNARKFGLHKHAISTKHVHKDMRRELDFFPLEVDSKVSDASTAVEARCLNGVGYIHPATDT